MTLDQYHLLADVFEYPDQHFPEKVRRVAEALTRDYPQAVQELNAFLQKLPAQNVDQMDELYTRSFDVQAITTLDIGYVLFGEDYKRGELLANLNREHVKAGVDCRTELADHLPNVLRLLSKLPDDELRHDLVHEILAPALWNMISEFAPERLDLKNEMYQKHYKTLIESPSGISTIYSHALNALMAVISKDFNIRSGNELKIKSDLLKSLSTELEINDTAKL